MQDVGANLGFQGAWDLMAKLGEERKNIVEAVVVYSKAKQW
jgi:hypothetical protein